MGIWYCVCNRRTGISVDMVAASLEALCRELGWDPLDCMVVRVGEMRAPTLPPASEPQSDSGTGATAAPVRKR